MRLCSIAAVVRERHAGVQRLVGHVVVGAAVKLIGSAAGREVEQAAGDQAILGREVRRLQAELLDGFDGRLRFVRNPRVEAARGLLTFEEDAESAGRIAVHLDRVPAGDGRARGQLHERERIADGAGADREIDRQGVDGVARNGGRLFGALGAEHGRFGRDFDRLVGLPDLQNDVDARRDRDLDADARLLVGAEARLLDGQVVEADGQGRDRVVARGAGDGVIAALGGGIDQRDLGVRNQRAAGVGHRAGDRAAVTLREAHSAPAARKAISFSFVIWSPSRASGMYRSYTARREKSCRKAKFRSLNFGSTNELAIAAGGLFWGVAQLAADAAARRTSTALKPDRKGVAQRLYRERGVNLARVWARAAGLRVISRSARAV